MEYKEEEDYVLLNFKDQVDLKFFDKPNLFFKIVDFDSKTPFIQIGNHVFTAKVDEESLGTSLIFEEDENPPPLNIYEKETHINLKYLTKATRIYSLQWFKVPNETVEIDPSEQVDLEFKYSYSTYLKQLETGEMNIEDVVKKPHSGDIQMQEAYRKKREEKPTAPVSNSFDVNLEDIDKSSSNDSVPSGEDFALLKDLVHQQANDPEYYNILMNYKFTNDKEYNVLKEIYLKSFNYGKYESEMKKTSIWEFVDLQGSIEDNIVEVKERLTEEDKKKLFSIKNFDNFSLDLKIMVLTDYLKEQKELMKGKTNLELLTEDEFGRTVKKRYKMVKSLVKDMKYNLLAKCINYNTFS